MDIKKLGEQISPTLEGLGYELVDIEYVKKYGDMHLIIYIDTPAGITLDDCEKASNALDPLLDEINPTADAPYSLDVSSPGLDRPFKKQRDYERNYGKEVEIKLYAPIKGKKIIEGILKEKTENVLTVEVNGEDKTIECNRIAVVRPLVKFE